jgi:MFS family permease
MSGSAAGDPAPPSTRKVAAATFVGSTIEWYDFSIYGSAAALVFGPQFFRTFSPAAGVLAAFGTFAAGFVARPLGAALFGHVGDRLGRKRSLVASLLLMGVGTLLIAALPTYAQVGVAAPLLLVTLRFVQGLGVGGEWGGAVLMAMEHAPARRRAFYSSFPQMGIPAGLILANLAFLLVGAALPAEQFAAWGWRIPFLFSALLVVTALVIRLRLEESPEFTAARRSGAVRRLPVLDVLRTNPGRILLGTGVTLAPSALGYFYSVYLLSYGTTVVGFAQPTLLLLITIGAVFYLATAYVSGRVADRAGPTRLFLGAMAASVVAPSVVFLLVETGSVPGALAAVVILGVLLGVMVAVQAVIVSRAFRTSLRYSGASLSYQLGAVVGGGLSPLLAATIQTATGSSQAVAGYLALLVVVSAICIARLPRDGGTEAGTEAGTDGGTERSTRASRGERS